LKDADYWKQNLFLLIGCMTLYVVNRFTKFHEVNESILKYAWDYNFTDFLGQIVYFALCNLVLGTLYRKGVYKLKTIITLSIFCCLYWEIGVLITESDTVFDVYDWVAYLLGAICYYRIFRLLERRYLKKTKYDG